MKPTNTCRIGDPAHPSDLATPEASLQSATTATELLAGILRQLVELPSRILSQIPDASLKTSAGHRSAGWCGEEHDTGSDDGPEYESQHKAASGAIAIDVLLVVHCARIKLFVVVIASFHSFPDGADQIFLVNGMYSGVP